MVTSFLATAVMITLCGAVKQMRTSLRFPRPSKVSGRKKDAPLGESGCACLLEVNAVLEVALRRNVVVDRSMD